MKIILKIAFRNVILHWRKSLAAIVSLAAGLVSIVMFQGYMDDVKRMYIETFRSRMMYGDVIIEHESQLTPEGRAEPWKYSISPENQKLINQFLATHENKIVAAVPFLYINGVVTNGRTSLIFRGYGFDVNKGKFLRGPEWEWNTLYGKPLGPEQSHGAAIGQSLGKYLNCYPDIKEQIFNSTATYSNRDRTFSCQVPDIQLNITTPEGQLNAIDVQVVGLVDALYKDIDDKFVTVSLPEAQALMNTKDISYFTAKLHDDSEVDPLLENFNNHMRSKGLGFRMTRWMDHIVGDMYVRTMSLLSVFRNFVMTIIIAIASLSIFNTLMKIVKERTREIGTLQSLGFISRQIIWIFVIEALYLSVMGGAIGSIIAVVGTLIVNLLGIVYKAGILVEPVPLKILINPDLYMLSFILLSMIASVTAWLVCRSAVKKNASENLSFA